MSRTGAFKRRYTVAQTAAIVAAQVDHKLSAAQAIDAAARGALPPAAWATTPDDERGPFTMPEATARSYAGEERQRRRNVERARSTPDEIVGRAIGEIGAALEREVAKLKAKQGRGQLVAVELERAAKACGALADAVRKTNGRRPAAPATPTGGDDAAAEPDDFVASLAADG